MAHRIRLVDDNERTRAAIRRLLERHGLRVREADAGCDAGEIDEADLVIVENGAASDEDRAWTWRDDDAAWERKLPELMEKYPGKFVAMYRGEIVGVGEEARDAAREGLKAVGRPVALFVARVGDPRPEPLDVGTWMGAPRSIEREQ